MNVDFFTQITDTLKPRMDHHRYIHTLGVAFTASSLAMAYHFDNPDRAMLAGLMHDCAKGLSDDEKIALCQESGVLISEAEYRNPGLLHAKAGAIVAEEEYWIHDEEILNAIRSHTTGVPNMTMLQKIIFVADFIEPNREDIIPNIDRIQKLAFEDIDLCVLEIHRRSLKYLETKGKEIDPITKYTCDWYTKFIEERNS